MHKWYIPHIRCKSSTDILFCDISKSHLSYSPNFYAHVSILSNNTPQTTFILCPWDVDSQALHSQKHMSFKNDSCVLSRDCAYPRSRLCSSVLVIFDLAYPKICNWSFGKNPCNPIRNLTLSTHQGILTKRELTSCHLDFWTSSTCSVLSNLSSVASQMLYYPSNGAWQNIESQSEPKLIVKDVLYCHLQVWSSSTTIDLKVQNSLNPSFEQQSLCWQYHHQLQVQQNDVHLEWHREEKHLFVKVEYGRECLLLCKVTRGT